jgi:hypothetical protein
MMVLGVILLMVAVWWIHWTSFPKTVIENGVEVPYIVGNFNWVPRGWQYKVIGYLAAFAASQLLLAGAAIAWVLNEKMTWARAAFTGLLAWIELVMIFGMVPSEWLNLAQTDLDWSKQKIFLTIPPWLVLGNEASISYANVKDAISMGYHLVMLGVGAVFAYQIQGISKPSTKVEKPKVSPYGRPLVKGGG